MAEEAASDFFASLGETDIPTEEQVGETQWRASGVAVLTAAQFVVQHLVAEGKNDEVKSIVKAAKDLIAEQHSTRYTRIPGQ